jgi:hypothetical protein
MDMRQPPGKPPMTILEVLEYHGGNGFRGVIPPDPPNIIPIKIKTPQTLLRRLWCYLSGWFNKTNFALSYRCRRCGYTSNDKDDLCEPVERFK